MDDPSDDLSSPASPTQQSRSRLPRFGLRTLLVAGIVCSLVFGWMGRGYFRAQREDAAIEALLQGGSSATFFRGEFVRDPASVSIIDRATALLLRSVGWESRPGVEEVIFYCEDPADPVAEECLAALHEFPEIERLGLTGAGFDDSAIRALDGLPRLTALELHRTSITGAGLSRLRAPEQIESLRIYGSQPEARLLSGVGAMKRLQRLETGGAFALREDMVAIAALPHLEFLDIGNRQATGNSSYQALAYHPTLKDVIVRAASFDDEEVAAIASIPRLENLWIAGATDEDLTTLAEIPNLRVLGLFEPISPAAARRLSVERPDITVFLSGPDGNLILRAGASNADSRPSP